MCKKNKNGAIVIAPKLMQSLDACVTIQLSIIRFLEFCIFKKIYLFKAKKAIYIT